MRRLIYWGSMLLWLLAGQAYAWDQICVYMKFGTWFVGWSYVRAGEMKQSGPARGVFYSSCIDIRSVPVGTPIYIWVRAAGNKGFCYGSGYGAGSLQNNSHDTLTFDAWGALPFPQCSGPRKVYPSGR